MLSSLLCSCQGQAVQQHNHCDRVCVALGSCWCHTIAQVQLNPCTLHQLPSFGQTALQPLTPKPSCGVPGSSRAACVPSCLRGLLPARPPACMPGGGQCRCRASTACVAGSRRVAALANSAQTGAAARPLSFPLCPFISTAGAWRSATFRRGKGETVLRPLGWHGAALRELGTDLLMPPAKAPAWGKAAFCHRAWVSHEGKGHWLCWKHAEGMSWWTVLSSG